MYNRLTDIYGNNIFTEVQVGDGGAQGLYLPGIYMDDFE